MESPSSSLARRHETGGLNHPRCRTTAGIFEAHTHTTNFPISMEEEEEDREGENGLFIIDDMLKIPA